MSVQSVMDRSPYQLGFCTLDRETSLDDLPVQGTVPPWLTGTLVRTAPAKFEVGNQGYNHWFDGLAMLHKFAFTGGRVAYANRYLCSRSYLEAMATGRISRETETAITELIDQVEKFFSTAASVPRHRRQQR